MKNPGFRVFSFLAFQHVTRRAPEAAWPVPRGALLEGWSLSENALWALPGPIQSIVLVLIFAQPPP